jgi:D-sedoheptulose 7-phosphate isomerase
MTGHSTSVPGLGFPDHDLSAVPTCRIGKPLDRIIGQGIIAGMQSLLNRAVEDLQQIIPQLTAMGGSLQRLGEQMLRCWEKRGKVLVAGNGGSAADSMHLAEELSVRFMRNRRALAAVALCDPAAITCAGNDFGYDTVVSRQVEALGNPGDILIVFTTSGNSTNILRAIQQAKSQSLFTAAFLGRDGGKARGLCDVEFIIPANTPHRIQEGHKILFHTLCEWVDAKV